MSSHNPYTKAAGAYGTTAAATDSRALEGTILLKAAQKLEDLAKRLQNNEKVSREEIGDVLDYNQKLWQLFVDNMKNPDHLLPQDIKNNVASLALFIFKRTHEILADTVAEKFTALVNINRNLAAGLMKRPAVQQELPEATINQTDRTGATDSMA